MNGVFSPIAVGAAVAFCAFATAGQSMADETPGSECIQSAHFLILSPPLEADDAAELALRESGSRQFPYLNYVTLSQNQAFEGRDWVLSTSENSGSRFSTQISGDGSCRAEFTLAEDSVNPVTLTAAETRQLQSSQLEAEGAEKDKAVARKTFVPKPISSIRLNGIQRPVSRTGEPLQVPDTQRAHSDRPHSVEEHFTAEPWHRAHPPRNTFAFRHQPLYFEDPNLERCGQSAGCLTEAVNIAHFAGRIPLTGYMMGSNPPCSCVRALPDCPTCQSFGLDAYLPRPTVRALATQAATTTGMIFLIP